MYPSNTILYATAIKVGTNDSGRAESDCLTRSFKHFKVSNLQYLQISCLQLIIFLPTPLQEHNLKLSLSSNLLEILSYEKHMRLHGMCKTSTRIFMCMHKQPDGTGLPLESCAKRNQMRFNEAGY
uniref:Uncharacterized protein n=1 Tax=Glossina palpalis gambiensis TaxID=67801 RepID=A0A1B0AN64_9MUSC